MVTFTRGDIVRLRSDEQEAERCEGESSREHHRSRRYIVLGVVESGFSFVTASGVVARAPVYALFPIGGVGSWFGDLRASELDLIATGERAEEIA